MIAKAPIRFKPFLKTVIWGGNGICEYKGIEQTASNIGESWEISAVPGHESVVEEGVYEGFTLKQLVDNFGPSLLGEAVCERYGRNFPLLVKFIDAKEDLSVQVHPDDSLAMKRHGCLGKTEMWYIIDSTHDAKIYAGLKASLTPKDFEKRVADQSLMDALAVHDSYPGDVFFLPAGRIHAIGAGNLLAEIQESSDITYRIHDYGRRDKNGNFRELHTDLAKDAIDYMVYPDYKQPSVSDEKKDCELVSCEHFTTHKVILKKDAELKFDKNSFTVLMCIEGDLRLLYPQGEMCLSTGQTVLIPADLCNLHLEGEAVILIVRS